MTSDRTVGGVIFGGSMIGIIMYALLLAYPQTWELTLRVTAFLAVTLLLAILAWIGWTMATTPPPEPITDIPDTIQEKQPAPDASQKKD